MKVLIGVIALLIVAVLAVFILGAIKDSIFIHFNGNPYDE